MSSFAPPIVVDVQTNASALAAAWVQAIGTAGALAFVAWQVWNQRRDLALQREELRLQRSELARLKQAAEDADRARVTGLRLISDDNWLCVENASAVALGGVTVRWPGAHTIPMRSSTFEIGLLTPGQREPLREVLEVEPGEAAGLLDWAATFSGPGGRWEVKSDGRPYRP